jgi:hypothetical protein
VGAPLHFPVRFPVAVVRPPASVEHEQDEIGRGDDLPAPPDPLPLDRVEGLPQSGRVDDPERDPGERDLPGKVVPRGARDLRDDGALLPEDAVQQAGFAYVRHAGDRGRGPVPVSASAGVGREDPLHH